MSYRRIGLLLIVAVAAVMALVILAFILFSGSVGSSAEVSINEVISMANRGQVESIEVRGDSLTVTTISGETFESRKESGSSVVEMLRGCFQRICHEGFNRRSMR